MSETGTMYEDCPFCHRPALRFWHGRYPLTLYACGTMASELRIERTNHCRRITQAEESPKDRR